MSSRTASTISETTPRTRRVRALAGLLDAVLPNVCAGCVLWIRGESGGLCGTCRAALNELESLPYCRRCGRTMSPLSIHKRTCARCAVERHWNTAALARVGPYVDPLRHAIVELKFAGQPRQAELLGERLACAIRQQLWRDALDLLVPVPMHPLRRRQRPGNHAEELARAAGRRLRVPVRSAAVRRRTYARSQTAARSRAERFRNVKGCFGPTRRPRVAGKTVCVVDNLVVSGATLHEVTKVLRAAGAKRIYAAIVARSVAPADFQAGAESAAAWSAPPTDEHTTL